MGPPFPFLTGPCHSIAVHQRLLHATSLLVGFFGLLLACACIGFFFLVQFLSSLALAVVYQYHGRFSGRGTHPTDQSIRHQLSHNCHLFSSAVFIWLHSCTCARIHNCSFYRLPFAPSITSLPPSIVIFPSLSSFFVMILQISLGSLIVGFERI